ncbi:MAG: hypothetical protein ABSC14_07925, partial [Desulfomonilia bacterium]
MLITSFLSALSHRPSSSEREAGHWPVKNGDLLGRPSRRHELIDKAGNYAIYGREDVQAKLRE